MSLNQSFFERHFLRYITHALHSIMASQKELVAEVQAITATVVKIGTETAATLQKVIDLQAIIDAGPEVSAELQAAVDALKAQAQAADDLVPDGDLTV